MIGKINYIGWLGHENLGDEAIFEAAKSLLEPFALEPHDNYDFLCAPRGQFIPFAKEASSCVSVFGGGTLLPDDITWVKPSKYNYLFGAGVKDPSFQSKFQQFNRVMFDRLKGFNFRLCGVRDNFSKDILSDWGIQSEVIGDPALSLESSSNVGRNQRRIAINVGCDGLMWGGDQKRVVHELVQTCKILKNKGYELVAVPFSKQDLPDVKMLSEKANIQVFDKRFDLHSILDLVASCKVLVGERMHSLAISAAVQTPFVCLEYRPKCRSFSETVGFSKYCLRTDAVKADSAIAMIEDLLANWDSLHSVLVKEVSVLRRKQRVFSKRIISDMYSLPDNAWHYSKLREKARTRVFWDVDVLMRKSMFHIWQAYNELVFLRIMRYLL